MFFVPPSNKHFVIQQFFNMIFFFSRCTRFASSRIASSRVISPYAARVSYKPSWSLGFSWLGVGSVFAFSCAIYAFAIAVEEKQKMHVGVTKDVDRQMKKLRKGFDGEETGS